MKTRSVGREIAKFLSGIAANETLGHWWLGIWGQSLLPMKLGWFEFTSRMNVWCMVAWPVVLVALVWMGWGKRGDRP